MIFKKTKIFKRKVYTLYETYLIKDDIPNIIYHFKASGLITNYRIITRKYKGKNNKIFYEYELYFYKGWYYERLDFKYRNTMYYFIIKFFHLYLYY